jgi:hypothetical protein
LKKNKSWPDIAGEFLVDFPYISICQKLPVVFTHWIVVIGPSKVEARPEIMGQNVQIMAISRA